MKYPDPELQSNTLRFWIFINIDWKERFAWFSSAFSLQPETLNPAAYRLGALVVRPLRGNPKPGHPSQASLRIGNQAQRANQHCRGQCVKGIRVRGPQVFFKTGDPSKQFGFDKIGRLRQAGRIISLPALVK